jgi:hypothetical protein
LNYIARYRNGTWFPLPNNGLNFRVFSLAAHGNDLYVGGAFSGTSETGAVTSYSIIKLGQNAWSALPNSGLNGIVYALEVVDDVLYAGGDFRQTKDGAVKNLSGIASFGPSTGWKGTLDNGVNGTVYAMRELGKRLYIGGKLSATGDGKLTDLGNIAFVVGDIINPLPNGGLYGDVLALTSASGVLYVGGAIARSGDGTILDLNRIAVLSKGETWMALPHKGLNNAVRALAANGANLFVGGRMSETADGAVKALNRIANFDMGANVMLNQSIDKVTGVNEFNINLVVTNRGPGTATGIHILDVIPTGYTPTSATVPGGTCSIKKKKVNCEIPEMPHGAKAVGQITIRYSGSSVGATNCAELTTTSYDPNPENHKKCAWIPAF